jgi:hypothetical protein
MSKITSLSEKDVALFPQIVDKWVNISLSVTPTNCAEAEKSINAAYEVSGLKPPVKFVWFESPKAGYKYVKDVLKASNAIPIYGQFDSAWLSFYDFFDKCESVDIPEIKKLYPLMEICKQTGWWWAFSDLCVATKRHTEIHRDAANRLHCEDGMAIKYGDGWGLYSWHGFTIPKSHHWIITDKARLNPSVIEKEANAELRRIMLEIYGFSNYLEEAKAVVLSEDKDILGNPRRLLEITVNKEKLRVLEVTNSTPEPDGSLKKYHLGAMPGKTPQEAVAASFGFNPEAFKEATVS